MNFFAKVVVFSFTSVVLVSSSNKFLFADPDTTSEKQGYSIVENKKGVAVKCYDSTNNRADESICEQYSVYSGSQCTMIASTALLDEPQYLCNPPGESFCKKDSDCKILGKATCAVKPGSSKRFQDQYDNETDLDSATDLVGICVSGDATKEDNAISQAICNLMSVVTGNTGRAVVAVVVIVVGVMFFLGKVTWSMVLAIALGAGAIFGAGPVVKIITGGSFRCIQM